MIPKEPSALPPAIESARIRWQEGQPESEQFGDIYFSRDNGLEEARYVFLQHNELESRFRNLKAGESFVIAESGFGSGLSFLAAWQLWQSCSPPPGAVLHFVSVERYPFTKADLTKANQLWPELSALSDALAAQYPPLAHGLHRRLLDDGQVRLSLFFGDALDGWNTMRFTADAWFLDGFAPALNPELWVDEVVDAVARHSQAGTTLATFTAVGRVRRALQSAGFTMRKSPGFGFKRNMLTGCIGPMHQSDEHHPAPAAAKPKSVVIVGAGIAGSLLASNLAKRGMRVTVMDAGSGPAQGASGNRQGALYVKLAVNYSTEAKLALSSLLFSQAFYQPITDYLWFPTGVLQLAQDDKEQRRQARFLECNDYPEEIVRPVTVTQARELTASNVTSGGLWFAGSGWLKPSELCQHLLAHPNITTQWNHRVSALSQQALAEFDHVVICAGHETPALLPEADGYRITPIRGQITQIASDQITAPKAVICGRRYLNPASDGYCLAGATFDLKDATVNVTPHSHTENLDELEAMISDVWQQQRPLTEDLSGRVGFRCTTHDYQPIAGELTDSNGAPTGVTLFTGLGSKGLTFAPLLAEWLADRITNQPEALTTDLQVRVRPERCRTGLKS